MYVLCFLLSWPEINYYYYYYYDIAINNLLKYMDVFWKVVSKSNKRPKNKKVNILSVSHVLFDSNLLNKIYVYLFI